MNIRIMIGVRTEQKVNSKSAVSRNLERTQTLDELNGTGNQTGNGSKVRRSRSWQPSTSMSRCQHELIKELDFNFTENCAINHF